ncbi:MULTISPECIES: hypothetical protein [Variovorax]|mgnify:CR=1 FL=1|jgi:hypothetical protein|uniref:hypothetical protein n=1 Tax=Variovorax TaxID=34072 RepID=UPI00086EC2E4|nr:MULTISPECIES: hypothetical protein [Variovorax]MBN8755197.1 hypothetical protein [Variovorax sp.]ODU16042.1 MAG: hypothetical protein ABS94_16145 [Variovorax sp. SCN 67-85]ODV22292.1 MAG: hypothetical protein ABT25_21325 [Variovorax sp. SCN 67-20]OJZ14240.1 MAG: hypothetical protein BGP22_05985 [Variovorax sp. 67-131]UKI08774.1 hypothetical protein L3V85_02660 [Variovorax paradoxus]
MSTATASINAQQVLAELRTRPGRDNGIHVRDLVARITGQAAPAPALERRVREFVSALRLQGEQICGKPDTGYFMAASAAELDETCRYLRSRAVSGLLIESRMRRVSMPALLGQLSLSAPKNNNATDNVNS